MAETPPDVPPASEKKPPATIAPPSELSRPTDGAHRPGFRSAPNKNSKAQKREKK